MIDASIFDDEGAAEAPRNFVEALEAWIGYGSIVPTSIAVRGALDSRPDGLPTSIRFWPKTPTRHHFTIALYAFPELFESPERFEARVRRMARKVIEGFHKRAPAADLRGSKYETLCIVTCGAGAERFSYMALLVPMGTSDRMLERKVEPQQEDAVAQAIEAAPWQLHNLFR